MLRVFVAWVFGTACITSSCQYAWSDDSSSIPSNSTVSSQNIEPRTVDLFELASSEQLEVKTVVPSAQNLYIRIDNRSNRDLIIQLPERFAAIPIVPAKKANRDAVLGQLAGPGINNLQGGLPGLGFVQGVQGGFQNGLQGGLQGGLQNGLQGGLGPQGNQGVGGGFNNNNGGFNNGGFNNGGNLLNNRASNFMPGNRQQNLMPGGGGGMFRVPAGRVGKLQAATVCLEFGKRDPNARLAYRLVPLDQFIGDKRVANVCDRLSQGIITQNVAQALAWHYANGLTWDKLAHLNRRESVAASERFFNLEELQLAMAIAEQIGTAKE